ncbi:hypothetical protein DY000_02029896, partial [Brassica cretica]
MGEAKGHVLFFPYPLQGHINPMIQLGKRLSKKGLTVSLIIASNIHREPYTSEDYSITVHTIHDGFFPHEHPHAKIKDPPRFNDSTARSLTDFISRYKVFSFFWQILKVCLLFFNWSTTSLKSPKLMVVKWMDGQWPVKNIGPVVPSKFLDNRLPEDKDYELGDSKTEPDESVLSWLANKPAKSVVYVAFGTLVALSEKQMKETAMAIKQTGYSFLWSVRDSERSKLPSGFVEEALEKDMGLVAKWVPQLE